MRHVIQIFIILKTNAFLVVVWDRVHDNVHDDMIMYVIMHDLHPVHRYDQHIIAMINSLS